MYLRIVPEPESLQKTTTAQPHRREQTAQTNGRRCTPISPVLAIRFLVAPLLPLRSEAQRQLHYETAD
jgi:hypothetical protein